MFIFGQLGFSGARRRTTESTVGAVIFVWNQKVTLAQNVAREVHFPGL